MSSGDPNEKHIDPGAGQPPQAFDIRPHAAFGAGANIQLQTIAQAAAATLCLSSCVLAELSSVQERWCGDAKACHRATPWTLHHRTPFPINSLLLSPPTRPCTLPNTRPPCFEVEKHALRLGASSSYLPTNLPPPPPLRTDSL
jgi:hypothetical protein